MSESRRKHTLIYHNMNGLMYCFCIVFIIILTRVYIQIKIHQNKNTNPCMLLKCSIPLTRRTPTSIFSKYPPPPPHPPPIAIHRSAQMIQGFLFAFSRFGVFSKHFIRRHHVCISKGGGGPLQGTYMYMYTAKNL